jgi:hypothetical protein
LQVVTWFSDPPFEGLLCSLHSSPIIIVVIAIVNGIAAGTRLSFQKSEVAQSYRPVLLLLSVPVFLPGPALAQKRDAQCSPAVAVVMMLLSRSYTPHHLTQHTAIVPASPEPNLLLPVPRTAMR